MKLKAIAFEITFYLYPKTRGETQFHLKNASVLANCSL